MPTDFADGTFPDPISTLVELFVDQSIGQRIRSGQRPILRPVFTKTHGFVEATLRTVLPEGHPFRIGLFANDRYRAGVRFSSDAQPSDPDLGSTLGVAIKLFGVDGVNLIDPQATGTADLIFQNINVFFVQDAQQMCQFTWAGLRTSGGYDEYLKRHPEVKAVLDKMNKLCDSVLTQSYWSIIPFKLGALAPVKYKLAPLHGTLDPSLHPPSIGDPDYLAHDLAARLAKGIAKFGLYVQPQLDPLSMPIDQAMVAWSEELSPPVLVAELEINQASGETPGQAEFGDNLSFNVWRTPPEHEPLGSIAAARRAVYLESAHQRRMRNGISNTEPAAPRVSTLRPLAIDAEIAYAKIHPSIGVARVGNSEQWFLAPEVPTPPLPEAGSRRDETGRLKRQAARFRVYGYNRAGEVVRELTASDATIEWEVHLANRKAEWFEFQIAQDIPEASSSPVPRRRNPQVDDRQSLVIDAGACHIGGRTKPAVRMDSGRFMGEQVCLGTLQTDEHGRLVIAGGQGRSFSPTGIALQDFANNDGWCDDVSDGPVNAKVRVRGKLLRVEPAWVVVAPPDYAPGLKGVRTLYDLLFDLNVKAGRLPRPQRVSYTRDVLPILMRLRDLGWANDGFAECFGPTGFVDLFDTQRLTRLASPAPEHKALRMQILHAIRPPSGTDVSFGQWPLLYGDSFGNDPVTLRQNATLTATQYEAMRMWANGAFDPDLEWQRHTPCSIEDVAVREQPSVLDRAALDHCLADAFHPGCEVTWPIRQPSIFSEPFRIKPRDPKLPEPHLGDVFQRDIELSRYNGVFFGQIPGGLTRWMAVPWQADTASCRAGYDAAYDPHLPTFWPARVPNSVLSEENYKRVVNVALRDDQRLSAFRTRENFYRVLPGPYMQQVHAMVDRFWELGLLEQRPGPADLGLPSTMLVEIYPSPHDASSKRLTPAQGHCGTTAVPTENHAVDESPEQRLMAMRSFRRVRKPS